MRFFRMMLESRLLCRRVSPRSPGSADDLLHRRDGHGANEAHHNNTHGDGQLSSESFRIQRAHKPWSPINSKMLRGAQPARLRRSTRTHESRYRNYSTRTPSTNLHECATKFRSARREPGNCKCTLGTRTPTASTANGPNLQLSRRSRRSLSKVHSLPHAQTRPGVATKEGRQGSTLTWRSLHCTANSKTVSGGAASYTMKRCMRGHCVPKG